MFFIRPWIQMFSLCKDNDKTYTYNSCLQFDSKQNRLKKFMVLFVWVYCYCFFFLYMLYLCFYILVRHTFIYCAWVFTVLWNMLRKEMTFDVTSVSYNYYASGSEHDESSLWIYFFLCPSLCSRLKRINYYLIFCTAISVQAKFRYFLTPQIQILSFDLSIYYLNIVVALTNVLQGHTKLKTLSLFSSSVIMRHMFLFSSATS